ncbi:MAG: MFS transporter [Clostridia bacterium]|nr:MFS transporter [Clostridia bacterium]
MKFNIREAPKKLALYCRRAPQGRYIPLKDIAAVSFGGMGVKFITNTVATMILSTGNVLIGNTIGIPPMPLYVIYLLSVLSNIPLTTLRARIVDYSHNAKGKYRPFVMYTAIPTAIFAIGFVYFPYDRFALAGKCAAVLAFNIGFQFFYNFLNDSNDNLVNVLSPNTYERSDVFSIKSIVDSFAPSLTNIIIPLIAKAVTGEEKIYDMRVYRAVYPPILVIGALMTVIIHVGTKEKIVQPKNHQIHIRFADTFRLVAKNKYFWIISLASCLGFLETAFFNVLGWMYNYQKVCSAGQYALITTIYGNASLWAMIFTPALIRRFGKKNLLVFTNILNIIFIAFMFPVVHSSPTNIMIWMFLICLFINGAVTQITVTITPSINGDIRDYQQYISGERVDGIFAVVGLIGSVWNLATGSILPAIYDRAGLNVKTAHALGFSGSNVYDVLYNEQYFRSICGVLILASVIGATMNVIPYFFYDLTEAKQKGMIAVLKIRAMLADYSDGTLEDGTLKEAVEIIEKAEADISKEKVPLTKHMNRKEKNRREIATLILRSPRL